MLIPNKYYKQLASKLHLKKINSRSSSQLDSKIGKMDSWDFLFQLASFGDRSKVLHFIMSCILMDVKGHVFRIMK